MKKLIAFLIGALLIAVALYFLSCNCGNRFQAKLNNKMGALVTSSAAFAGTSFALDGRDVTLTGRVDSQEIKSDLEAKAKAIAGVRSVTNELVVDKKVAIPTPVAPPQPITPAVQEINFVLDKDSNKITLNGVVADQAEMDALLASFEGYDVTNNLTIANLPEGWAGKSLGMADLSKKFERLKLGVAGNTIEFKGDINANERADLIQLQLRRLFPNANITSDIAMVGLDASVRDCQSAIKAILDAHAIQFGVGSDTIKPEGIEVVKQVVSAGNSCEGISYIVAGHTDDTGSDDVNQTLSQSRAQSVVDLMAELGIDKTNLEAKGYGSARPIADNGSDLGRQLNRRIDIWVD